MTNPFLENWVIQLRKGMLELCILNAIHGQHVYAYDLVKRLRDIEGLVISEGTIYPLLSRLKREGLIGSSLEESDQGPARKYYKLTDRGQKQLNLMNQHWSVIRTGLDALQNGSKP